jgi:apolipoprotein N-acyltransferase
LAFVAPALLLGACVAARRRGRSGWSVGAVAGAAGYGSMLVWLIEPAGVVAWVGLTAIQVVWWALLGALLARFADHRWLPLLGALVWVGVDAWRGTLVLGGFGWGTLAAAQAGNGWLDPLVRLAGEHALTFAVVLLSLAATDAARRPLEAARDAHGRVDWSRVRTTLAAGSTGAAILAGAAVVFALATIEPPAAVADVDVLIVQGNDIETWSGTGAELDATVARQHLAETARAIGETGRPDLTVWAESSIDRDPGRTPVLAGVLSEAARLTDGRLLAGATLDGPDPATTRFVTLLDIDRDGATEDRYDKRHLVPFGEYIPARDLLEWFPPLRQVPRDAIPGDRPVVLDVDGLTVAPAICFESMFSDVVRSNVLAGDEPAGLVVIATNDASFGRTGEPLQHLAQARLRALETGRWVVFASISGHSSFVDPEGRLHGLTGLYEVDHLRATVPVVADTTPFLATGDWFGMVARGSLVVMVVIAMWRGRARR